MSWFDDIWNEIVKRVEALWEAIAPALNMFAKTIVEGGGTILLNAAGQAIAKVAADPALVSNSDKRNAAIQEVLSTMAGQGITLAETAALNAIQAAYSNIKAGLNADGTPAS